MWALTVAMERKDLRNVRVVGSERMRFFREKGWVETGVKRWVRGRSKRGGKRLKRTEGGGMLEGGGMMEGGEMLVGGGGEVTWSAASQPHASASIPVAAFVTDFAAAFAVVSAGRSAKSPQSSSGWFSTAGESRYISGTGT